MHKQHIIFVLFILVLKTRKEKKLYLPLSNVIVNIQKMLQNNNQMNCQKQSGIGLEKQQPKCLLQIS